jgi:MFS family permease
MDDRKTIYAAAFVRSTATGMVGVLFGIYLSRIQFSPAQIGYAVGAGLAGGAVATLLVTVTKRRTGRKRLLLNLAVMATAGGGIISAASNPVVVGVAAFLGMINGMGRDRGAALVIEQAILPETETERRRTRVFAIYNVLQDIGHALGGLLAGTPEALRRLGLLGEIPAIRFTFGLYALLMAVTFLLYLGLSPVIERRSSKSRGMISPRSRRTLWKISSLFTLDGLGGGFLTTALLSFFFFERFGVGEGTVGLLFFGARVANAVSHLGAAWLAERIGLVNTMVFTHIPSSLLLVTVAFAPSFPVAALLFLLREGLVEMDVPTRQSYVMAVVRPEERAFASGVTHLVRTGAWALAPVFAGLSMEGVSLATPLFIGAAMKIVYDLLLYAALRGRKPPEERRPSTEARSGPNR